MSTKNHVNQLLPGSSGTAPKQQKRQPGKTPKVSMIKPKAISGDSQQCPISKTDWQHK